MWIYEKKLQYPVKIKNPDPMAAKLIMTQLGGPDGETGAAMRYLNQRFACPYDQVTGILTDVGTEESVPRGYQRSDKTLGLRTPNGRQRVGTTLWNPNLAGDEVSAE